ncbi:MAG: hypothetical protein HPY90_05475 [Syntrophothermus sp.]|uniref:hypothetical protein n=1 Tax=Syntrophothermus sp. TaxID=2736299 RepID=UPI00257CE75C|nr:hypothetical protein [Syntrophothermus sp.]NSW82714.1 hypothetical protein [Syntrophothermus sp.]
MNNQRGTSTVEILLDWFLMSVIIFVFAYVIQKQMQGNVVNERDIISLVLTVLGIVALFFVLYFPVNINTDTIERSEKEPVLLKFAKLPLFKTDLNIRCFDWRYEGTREQKEFAKFLIDEICQFNEDIPLAEIVPETELKRVYLRGPYSRGIFFKLLHEKLNLEMSDLSPSNGVEVKTVGELVDYWFKYKTYYSSLNQKGW